MTNTNSKQKITQDILKTIYEPILGKYFENDIDQLFEMIMDQLGDQGFKINGQDDVNLIYKHSWDYIKTIVDQKITEDMTKTHRLSPVFKANEIVNIIEPLVEELKEKINHDDLLEKILETMSYKSNGLCSEYDYNIAISLMWFILYKQKKNTLILNPPQESQ